MKKRTKSFLGILLALMLCLPLIPTTAFAATEDIGSSDTSQVDEIPSEEPAEELPPEYVDEASPVPDEGTGEVAPEPGDDAAAEPAEEEPEEIPTAPISELTPVDPELVKVVDEPLVKVMYHYYDAQTQEVASFEEYLVLSTHAYYAIAMANGADITIAANQFPGIVAVSTDALRFRVLLNGSEDITSAAAYDVATGLVSLPASYMGHKTTVEWYCPASEIVELPVKVTATVWEGGQFFTSTHDLFLPSNASSIPMPLSEEDGLVVSQNDIELPAGAYSFSDGTLTVSTSPLGGDLAVVAYVNVLRLARNSGGQVAHTRSEDTIYYGYYTHYFTANGNTAFCLQPSVPSAPTGTYPVSRYLQPGVDDALIKCAYYLYGGPGYDSVKHNLFEDPDSLLAYAYSHLAAAYAYSGNSAEAFYKVSPSVVEHLMAVYASVCAQPMPPAGFDAFVYNEEDGSTQSFLGWNYVPAGTLEIIKVSGNPSMTDGNSCYSLAGAVFDVYNSGNQKIGSITTDSSGRGKLEGIEPGTGFYIVEVTPPKGFALSKDRPVFSIVSGETTSVPVKNMPQNDPVGILLRKQDADKSKPTPQGNASLEGAEFTVKFYKGHYSSASQLSGITPARTWVLRTGANGTAYLNDDYLVSGDPFYYAGNGDPTLPLGTITVQESKPPEGYLICSEIFIRQITSEGVAESVFTYNEPIVPDAVIRGGVEIEKWDIERDETKLKQGDATLAGAIFDIYNRGRNSVVVNGTEYAPGKVVHTITTNAEGWAGTASDLLPYSTYEIVERTSPIGMLNTGIIRQTFDITEHGVIVDLTASDKVIKNNVIRGGVYVEKWDNEIDENRAQGGATLEGAVFEIINWSIDSVLVDDVLYAPGEVVYTMITDATGAAETAADLLPYGTYELREAAPPSYGYLATGVLSRMFVIREHGVIVQLNTTDTAIKNNPIRGDLRGVKISDGDAKRLANVPFSITSVTTGESHIVVTDINGEFSTASSWNPHSQNTNRGETDRDGVWFGELWTLNDDLGALLYDTYLIEELPCDANEGYELLSFEASIYRHNTVVDLGTLTDDRIPTPEIFTTARDQITDENSAYVSETTTILDTVYYSGLKPGQEYTLKGVLMDKETGEPLLVNGEEVTAEATFRAAAESGSVTMAFTFDSTALKGKSVVVFESLEFEGEEIAVHADIEDEYQTVTFVEPEIGTSAAGADGEKELGANTEVTLVDTVSYKNLVPGKTYTINGILMDKGTGKPLQVSGAEVTATTTFTPEEPSGTVDVVFTFDATSLKGKTVAVFESLEHEGVEIAVHADIEDEGQTVTFGEEKPPKIGTTAKAEDGSKTVPIAQSVTVVDTVAYENLTPNKTYVLKGVLMDKESGKPLTKDGVEVTAETKFTPTSPSGTVEVRFTFDSRAIEGRTLVVFESLVLDGKEVAVHADLRDEAQAVTVAVSPPDEPELPKPTPPPTPGKPVPQTSDDNMAIVWIALLGISLIGATVSFAVYLHLRRKKGKRRMIAAVALALCVALTAASGYMLTREAGQYTKGAAAYEKLAEAVAKEKPVQEPQDQGQEPQHDEEKQQVGAHVAPARLPSIDFDALLEVNPDIRAWLDCEGSGINYPVVQGEDNEYYLRRMYDGTRNKAGCLFIDYENEPFTDRNTIIYGHNLLDGSMFSELTGYREQDYYEAHPDMLLATPDGGYIVEVFAAFVASPGEAGEDTSPWMIAWENDGAFAAWLDAAVERSLIQAGVAVEAGDRVLSLSTCINNGRDRFIVMGRLVPAQ